MDTKTSVLIAIILALGLVVANQFWFILSTTKNLDQHITSNAERTQQLATHLANQNSHWRSAGANYLINLANVQLHVRHDVTAAIYLLERAEQILAAVQDTAAQKAIQSIRHALATLKAIKPVPVVEINQQLIKIATQIPELTLTTTTNILPNEVLAPASTTKATSSRWHHWLTTLKNKAKNLIVLRNNDAIVLPIISSDIHALIEQNILSLLTQTQWAAMQAHNVIYHEHLHQIKWLIEHYYQLDNLATKNILTTIAGLQKIDVAPVLPDLSYTI